MTTLEQATPDGNRGGASPATAAERIASLDLIRGVAVLGILAANIVGFGMPWSAYSWPTAFLTGHDATSDWLWVAQFVLVDGKMRGLFTLLFGAGMALFMERAWARGDGLGLQARRLAILLVFGLIHFFLIWRGDILVLYSVAGFAAMFFLRMTAGKLLTLGLIGYVVGALFFSLTLGSTYFITETAFGQAEGMGEARAAVDAAQQQELDENASEIPIMQDGSYGDIVSHTFAEHAADPINIILFMVLETVPLMLIGMAFYRLGWFDPGGEVGRRRMWGWGLLIVGTVLNVLLALWVKDGGFSYWGTQAATSAFAMLPRLPMILGLALLLAIYGSTATGWLAQRLSAAGRVAFTNYIGTSVLMMLVFHPWAGGLWGDLTRPQLYLVVLFGWAVMLAWSTPWLARFRYGPLEWLWRCLTYGRLFPLRR
ncbi:DUF418 domain-containing protein [Aurantiacibacter rhizosphaerae]|uniref:DUF418 domain-containing protein n=1 Tax=Aurantiacibacter rhizosphaerae TaxID=2691582 RepID=A0A844XA69_9SPHN|nr:DUF418 domain-containing protein [Aurantiacibacter rhizosphaerae]MWV27267.1 DUF418 domain-containing protein [Aurantiacibacter rhizosphaerae]